MKGFIRGISDAFNRAREPFTSESIVPEAIIDIVIRGGVTDTGKKLYTEQTQMTTQMLLRILLLVFRIQLLSLAMFLCYRTVL